MSSRSRYDLRLVLPALCAWLVAMAVTTGRGFGHEPTMLVIGACVALLVVAVWMQRSTREGVERWRGVILLAAGIGLVVGCVGALHAEVRHPAWTSEMELAPGPLTVTATIAADVKPVAGSQLRGQPRWWLSVSDATITDTEGKSWTGARASVVANQPEDDTAAETDPPCARDQQPGETLSWGCVAMGQQVTFTAAALPIDPVDGQTTLFLADPTPHVAAPPSAFTGTITSLRDGLKAASAHLAPQGQGLVPGITVGDVTDLPDDINEAMLLTSLTHITAVSGAHFAILSTALLFVLTLARVPRPLLIGISATVMALFVVLVRPEPSVLRAAGMGAIALTALWLRRPSQGIPALAATVIGLLLIDPWLARAYGFVLSVAATAGIIVLTGPLQRLIHRPPQWMALVIAVPTAAQLACGPIIILLEPHVTMYSIPANVLAAPAVPPATILGILALCIAPFHTGTAELLTSLAGMCTQWITWVAQTFAGMPGASLNWWPEARGVIILGVLSVAVAWAVLTHDRAYRERSELGFGLPGSPRRFEAVSRLQARWKRAHRRVKVVVWMSATLIVTSGVTWGGFQIAVLVTDSGREDWHVAACDVGQGTAVLVHTGKAADGGHRALVMDTGPDPELISQCLDLHRVTEVDAVLVSHLHADHVGGIAGVIGHVTVGEVWLPDIDVVPVARAALEDLTAQHEMPLRHVGVGARGDGADGAVTWEVLWPYPDDGAPVTDASSAYVNDMSLVTLVTTPHGRILSTGDIESLGQVGVALQLREYGIMPGEIEIVVIPHHGSATQEAALSDGVAAPIAIASAGADNSYGHPTARAIDMYARHGIVLSTHACGTITLTSVEDEWHMNADGPAAAECRSD